MSKIDHETVSPVSANDDSRATARSPVLRSSAPRGCWWERLSSGAIGCSVSHRRRRHGLGNLPPRATKSDAFDAFTLADSVRHEHRQWRSLAVPSMLLAEFRALTRDQDRLIWEQRDVESKLRGIVQNYYPAVLPLFSSLDRDISLAFLRDTPPHSGRTGRGGRMAAFCGSPRIIRSYQARAAGRALRTNPLSASAAPPRATRSARCCSSTTSNCALGQLRWVLGGRDLVLSPGEVVELDTRTPHGSANPGQSGPRRWRSAGDKGERMDVRP